MCGLAGGSHQYEIAFSRIFPPDASRSGLHDMPRDCSIRLHRVARARRSVSDAFFDRHDDNSSAVETGFASPEVGEPQTGKLLGCSGDLGAFACGQRPMR